MLKKEPRTFWMMVNLILLVVGMVWLIVDHDLHETNKQWVESGREAKWLIYVAGHVTFAALHGIVLMALPERD